MEKDEHSDVWNLIQFAKMQTKIISAIAIIELIVILCMGYFIYDSQFDYSTTETQDVSNTDVNNSSIVQY